ncbi:hypothetical protein D3C83_193160 [compost metagenome]
MKGKGGSPDPTSEGGGFFLAAGGFGFEQGREVAGKAGFDNLAFAEAGEDTRGG